VTSHVFAETTHVVAAPHGFASRDILISIFRRAVASVPNFATNGVGYMESVHNKLQNLVIFNKYSFRRNASLNFFTGDDIGGTKNKEEEEEEEEK